MPKKTFGPLVLRVYLLLAQRLHCFAEMAVILDNLYSQENYLISKKLLDATHLPP